MGGKHKTASTFLFSYGREERAGWDLRAAGKNAWLGWEEELIKSTWESPSISMVYTPVWPSIPFLYLITNNFHSHTVRVVVFNIFVWQSPLLFDLIDRLMTSSAIACWKLRWFVCLFLFLGSLARSPVRFTLIPMAKPELPNSSALVRRTTCIVNPSALVLCWSNPKIWVVQVAYELPWYFRIINRVTLLLNECFTSIPTNTWYDKKISKLL